MTEEIILNENQLPKTQEDYDAIQTAIEELSRASEKQFETIKKEKWYIRVFDMLTFSQKKKIRLAEQIGTVAKAQEVFVELLLRLSISDKNISQLVMTSMSDIKKRCLTSIF